MTDTAAPTSQPAGSSKGDPGKLDLRAAPRRVVRFKRGLVIGAAALGSGAVLGVTMMALQGPTLRIQDQAEELYNTERKPTPDGLAALPGDYSQVKPEAPQLGPPLPGDLGRPILERQAAWDCTGWTGIVRRGAAPRPAGHPGEGGRRLLSYRETAAAGYAGSDESASANGSSNRLTRR